VPSRAGPGPNDPSSVVWLYHGHTDEVADSSAGLVGSLIISRPGTLGADGLQNDVDREFVLYFTIFNEAASLFYNLNVQQYLNGIVPPYDSDDSMANERYTINGYVYGNGMQYISMNKGEVVRWYLIALGSEVPYPIDATSFVRSLARSLAMSVRVHRATSTRSFGTDRQCSRVRTSRRLASPVRNYSLAR